MDHTPSRALWMTNVSKAATTLALCSILAACGSHPSSSASGVLPGTTGTGLSSAASPDVATTIVYLGGAGLSGKALRQWFDYYGVALPPDSQGASNGLPVNASFQYYYDADGAGNGIISFISQTPDPTIPSVPPYPCPGQSTSCVPYPQWDGASADGPLTADQVTCYQVGGPCGAGSSNIGPAQPARGQYLQLPTFETDLALPYNPNGQTVPTAGLQLSRNSYCGIWEGAITNWGDPSITSDNGGIQVSTQPIELIVRSDNAGATQMLTEHLNVACQNLSNPANDWTRGVGSSGITWPSNSLSFKGQSGIVSGVTSTPGGIGYVSPSFVAPVVSGGLPSALLQNNFNYTANNAVFTPQSVTSTLAAFKGIQPPSNPNPWDLGVSVTDPLQKGAYPIVAFVYFDLYQCYQGKQTPKGIKALLKWYAAAGPTGTTPADVIVQGQGFAPLLPAFKKKVKSISVNLVQGPIVNTCTI
jgi:phosphate transport system substrate-binding protein